MLHNSWGARKEEIKIMCLLICRYLFNTFLLQALKFIFLTALQRL